MAVVPALPPGPAVVTTWTAAPSRLIASRNTVGSTVRTISGPTAVKAPSMASSGRWSIQLTAYSAARLGVSPLAIATSSGVDPRVAAPAILVVVAQTLLRERDHPVERSASARVP